MAEAGDLKHGDYWPAKDVWFPLRLCDSALTRSADCLLGNRRPIVAGCRFRMDTLACRFSLLPD